MSAAKEAAAVKHSGGESGTPSVVVVKKPLTAKRLMKIVIVAIVVIAVLAGLSYWLLALHTTKTSSQKINAAVSEETAASGPHANAKDTALALSQLQSVSGLAKTTSQKVALYGALAQAYESNDNPQKAIYYYQLEDQLDPSKAGIDAESEAGIYQRLGENAQAIAALKRDIAYIQQDTTAAAWSKQTQINIDNGNIQALEANQ